MSEFELEQDVPEAATPTEAKIAARLFHRVAIEQDAERIKVGAALMNVLNYAVQVQANRDQWKPDDFRAFITAYSAIDQIGQAHIAETNAATVEKEIASVQERMAQNAKQQLLGKPLPQRSVVQPRVEATMSDRLPINRLSR